MGEADSYYAQPAERGGKPQEYQQQQQYQQQYPPPQQAYNGGYQQNGYDQQAAYQQQPPQPPPPNQPPPAYTPPQDVEGEKYSYDQAFKIEKPKYNDWWAGILFLLVFAGYVAVSGITIHGYAQNYSFTGGGIYGSSNDFSLNTNTMILFVFVLGIAVVFSYAYVWLARLFPKQFIWVTGILNILWAFGTAIYYLVQKYWSGGIVFLVFAVFIAFCFYTWISRIPFSALMLKTSIDVSKKYGHTYIVSLVGGLAATAFGAWYSVTLVAIYVKYEPSDNNPSCSADGSGCSNAKVIGLIAFVTFAMYWISEWIKNTIHTIISGVYGSWYFCAHNFPKDATRAASRRALTYSFGSIALGSLLVALVQCLRQLCSIARGQARGQGGMAGMAGAAVFCFLGCLIRMLEWAVRFLNRYAFSHIALYGKAYFAAAKDTWQMIKDRGIDALINQCLIGPVLSFGATFIAFACALFSYLYLLFTDPAYNRGNTYTPVIMAFSFLIGFQIANIFTTPMSSGIDAIFVAAGWDPQVMVTDHPELYAEMVKVYPKVKEAIRVR